MSDTFSRIVQLVEAKRYKISIHAFNELLADELTEADVILNIGAAEVLEDYPDFPKGPSVLLLQRREDDRPVHTVWGIPKDHEAPAVLVTAYVPDPAKWSEDFKRRRS